MLYAGNLSKKIIGVILVAMTMLLGLTSSVGATLIDNGDGTVTCDDLGIMWLQEPPPDDVYSGPARMTWDEAMTWAANLVFAGYDDWRLPSAKDFDTGLPDTGYRSINNEWGYLYGVEWDNPGDQGDILPMTGYWDGWYWTSTEDPGDPTQAYAFDVTYDNRWFNDEVTKSDPSVFVTAVRDVSVKVDTETWFTIYPNPARPDELITLTGLLHDVYDNPISAQVDVEYSTDGGATWHYAWTLNTNTAGQFSKKFNAPVGEYLVKVSYAGSATYNPSSHTETLTVTLTKVNTVLDFWFNPNPVPPGGTVTLSGTLEYTVGGYPYPLTYVSVTVEYSTNGGATWHYLWTLDTNWDGQFYKVFTAPGAGKYLVRVSYAGSTTYNPSSDTKTLFVEEEAWGDYHFRISPFLDVLHLKISGNRIFGVCDNPDYNYHNQPVLGYIEGSRFYLFVDFTKYDDGSPMPFELAMFVGSVSTLSGNYYKTADGTSWVGPTAFSLVSASSTPTTTGSALASTVEPESWPPTYHFQLSPWDDIVRLGTDGAVLHGTDESASYPYHNQPVLGYVSGNFFIFAIDWTKDDSGDPIYFELGLIAGSVSTLKGNVYRTVDGKSIFTGDPTTITLIPVSP